MLCYGCVWSCVIHTSFALYGGMSFVLVTLTMLNVGEPEHWVTWSQYTLDNVFKPGHKIKNTFHLIVWSLLWRQSVRKLVLEPDLQTKIFVG